MTTLNETSRRQKAVNTVKGKINKVKTIGIISPENPMGEALTKKENEELLAKFIEYMKEGNIRYYKVVGNYNDNQENSFLLYNVALKDLTFLGKEFNQESFIFGVIHDNLVEFNYFEKEDENSEYQNMINKKEIKTIDDLSSTNYTKIGKNFRFRIPFFETVLNEYNFLIDERINLSESYALSYEKYLERAVNETLTPYSRMIARCHLNGCLWNWKDKQIDDEIEVFSEM